MQKELGQKHQKLVEDAQRNHRIAVKFLKASLGRWVLILTLSSVNALKEFRSVGPWPSL